MKYQWQWRRWLVGIQWFRLERMTVEAIRYEWSVYLYLGPVRIGTEWTTTWWERVR